MTDRDAADFLAVTCPWCDAEPGRPCVNRADGRRYAADDPHATRIEQWDEKRLWQESIACNGSGALGEEQQ